MVSLSLCGSVIDLQTLHNFNRAKLASEFVFISTLNATLFIFDLNTKNRAHMSLEVLDLDFVRQSYALT